MADKPSRALVLYGDGLARFLDPSQTHLHSLASKSLCGFLSLPNAPPSESEEERIVRESLILLDAFDAYQKLIMESAKNECKEKSLIPTIPERFMGMKAAILTNDSSLKYFGGKLGLTVLELNDLMKSNPHDTQLSEASELLKLLGFQDGKVMDTSQFDLVFVHVGSEKYTANVNNIEYLNSLVGSVMHITQPGSEISTRLHFSVVLNYGNISEIDDSNVSVLSKDEKGSHLSVLVPRQSYIMRGESERNDVRHDYPMLIAQWQYGVTRIDMADKFSFNDFKERGGNLVIPADRFLHEVAFKLWKAPKYGA